MSEIVQAQDESGLEIAVIGLAGRFPGAGNIAEFRENLKKGIESISFFSERELIENGIDPLELNNPNYIKAKGILKDSEYFDAGFFGYTPLESEIMDPQIRLFHHYSWAALEDAGYDPDAYDGLIGLYAGARSSFNWEAQTMISGRKKVLGELASSNLNDKDYLSMRICYKLNLKGPGYTIQTACSTSLAAVHLACRGLLSAECDLALAGGAAVTGPGKYGYRYREGLIFSPDGHCRTFDAKAEGTIFGEGIGVVVLKRLQNALEDCDHIYAVIKGSAVNNDGLNKIGFTAPGIEGQADVIRSALEMSEVDPETIELVEAHGTGTTLGDPIEIEALTRAFNTKKRNYCAVGSVKSNFGHLHTAAGVAGFIKAVLALQYKFIPPSLHFTTPNPKIDFNNTPFYINRERREWRNKNHPLRAGVSSFGIGGTNAHVILEESHSRGQAMSRFAAAGVKDEIPSTKVFAPLFSKSGPAEAEVFSKPKLILLSAKTETALDRMTANLAGYLKENPGINLTDAAYTLQQGRRGFQHRRMMVCRDVEEAIGILSSPGSGNLRSAFAGDEDMNVVFMFPGQGSQYVNMGLGLYRTEPVFREEMDRCFEILKPLVDYDFKEILYPGLSHPPTLYDDASGGPPFCKKVGPKTFDEGERRRGEPCVPPPTHPETGIDQTEITQPVIFAVEYALAKLLMKWGIKPYAMIGHSIGEYTAACLSGVLTLKDALKLVALRGRLMQQMPDGAMMSVSLAEDRLKPLLKEYKEISLAAVNAPALCVVSGPRPAVENLEVSLKEQGHDCRLLHTSHAFHSAMMDPILNRFEQQAAGIRFAEPQIPYISNLTGRGVSAEEVMSPAYWRKHLRGTVRFYRGLTELLKIGKSILVEVGPGTALSTFVNRHPAKSGEQKVVNLIRHPRENTADNHVLADKIGQLWLYGKKIDWNGFYTEETGSRIPLPAYPFEGKRYWIEREAVNIEGKKPSAGRIRKKADTADWFYIPQWTRSLSPAGEEHDISGWLVFMDEHGLGTGLVNRLTAAGHEPAIVGQGSRYRRVNNREFVLNPRNPADYGALFAELRTLNKMPRGIVHLWGVTRDAGGEAGEDIDGLLDRGFYSLLYLVQALGEQEITHQIRVEVVTCGMREVTGAETLCPVKAAVLGAVNVIPREYPLIDCRSIDIEFPSPAGMEEDLLDRLAGELLTKSPHRAVCVRGRHRWVQTFEPVRLKKPGHIPGLLKESGVYLITGGTGGIGLELAQYLAGTVGARLILTGRSHFPSRERWQEWLENHQEEDPTGYKIRRIRALEETGVEVLVHSADVTDRKQMQKVVDLTLKRFGRIDGVIHSAGVPGGGVMQLKSRETAERVLAPKVKGTLVLDELLGDIKPDFIMLCSSLMSIAAQEGQSDYAAANAFLDAYAHYKTLKDGIPTLSVNWDAWSETGMAAEASKRSRRSGNRVKIPVVKSPGRRIHTGILRVHEQWILAEHTLGGKGILPGTAYLEMAAAAFGEYAGTRAIQIDNVYFRTPLVIDGEEEKEVRTLLEKQENAFEFKIQSRVGHGKPGMEQWRDHTVGQISAITRGSSKKYDIEEILARCQKEEIPIPQFETGSSTGKSGIHFGPRWNNKKWIKAGETGALALLELPEEFAGDLENFDLHPALMDMATSFPMLKLKDQSPYYPFSYKRIRINRRLPAKIYSYVRELQSKRSGDESLIFDILILDEQGDRLVEIEGFTLLKFSRDRINRALAGSGVGKGSQTDEDENKKGFFRGGLLSAEGVDVFSRVLEAAAPQVVVSTRDLPALLERDKRPGTSPPADEAAPAAASSTTYQRPQLSVPYAAPRGPVETAIVQIWQKFFGIEPVGIHDDFFELGGDSLKVNTVAASLHKELDVGIPLGEFFNNPTAAKLAEYINSAQKTVFSSIKPVEKKEYYSLSSAQKRLYIIQQMTPQSTAYNTPLTVELEGQADRDRLNPAFEKLIQRHESLRTSFKLIEGRPVQAIRKNVEFQVDYYDSAAELTGRSATAADRARQTVIESKESSQANKISAHSNTGADTSPRTIVHHFIRPFDLAAAPLARVGLVNVTGHGPGRRYLLIIDIHHIISDRQGTGILVKDFKSFYSGEEIAPLKIQYRDYSQWKNKALEEKEIKKQEEYWGRVFAGEIPVLNLPFDYNRPPVQGYEGKVIKFEIGEEETAAVKQLLLDEKVTLFIFILSIYAVFLSRLSGQEDIVVGTPTAGRNHPDLEPLIGVFINTLALRNDCAGHKHFFPFLKEVKAGVLDAFDNQHYPFEDLVERIVVNRDLSRNPLFDVMFILFNEWEAETTREETPDTLVRFLEFEKKTSQFDLTLIALDMGNRLYFRFEYCTKLFKDETMQRFTGIFKTMVSSVLKGPDRDLSAIEIIPAEEKNRLLHEFNDTETDYARDKTIHRLFEEQVERTADSIAVVGQHQKGNSAHMTYKELDRAAGRLAHLSIEKGVEPGSIVGIMVERSIEMMAGILGIIKAGGAYLPLDPDYPGKRLAYIVEDSGASLILAGGDMKALTGKRARIVDIGDGNLHRADTRGPAPAAGPGDPFYVIYTSGSTGNPKGVMIENRSMVNLIKGITGIIDFGESDCMLSLTTISFDIFGSETILPLTRGSKVIVGTREEQLNPEAAARAMSEKDVTILLVTPSRLSILIADEECARPLNVLKYLLVTGEAFPEPLLEKTRKIRDGKIYNLYGPTETTIWSAVKDVTGKKSLNIGKPIANTRIYILDRNGSLQPIGVSGELCIAGAGLARGYLNRPGLTHEKFVASGPLFEKSGAKTFDEGQDPGRAACYKTGDIAKWLPDGNIDCLGRIDSQVKIRGFRIELSEIENQLQKHPGVKEAAAVVKKYEIEDKYIAAYIVPDPAAASDDNVLRDELKECLISVLPDYMIPSYFVFLKKFPLTPNGKIDRRALPAPEVKKGEDYIAPGDEIEEKLADIWSEVLGIEKEVIGIDSNFFELGGQSLKMIIMTTKIHKAFNVKVSLSELFRMPTIKLLAVHLNTAAEKKFTPIDAAEEKEYYELSSAQKRLYIIQHLQPENIGYNMPVILQLEGKSDERKLSETFLQLIKRHENFRTAFLLVNDEAVQRIYDEVDFKVDYYEIPVEADVKQVVKDFIRPFFLDKAPLLRVGLIKMNADLHILMLDMNHIISDGISMNVFVNEYMALYGGDDLPALKLQYKDYSQWQNSKLEKAALKKQEEYWLKRFEGEIPVIKLPTDFLRPTEQSFEGNHVYFEIGIDRTTRLKKLILDTKVTLYIFMLAIYNILLSKISGQKDIIVGAPAAGRKHADIQHIIGVFVNMLAFRNYADEKESFLEFLEGVKRNSLDAFDNQEYQFEELVDKLALKRQTGRSPLFDAAFMLENDENRDGDIRETKIPGLRLKPYGQGNRLSKYDLFLYVYEGDNIHMKFVYCTKLFKPETLNILKGYVLKIIDVVLENPRVKLSRIDISSKDKDREVRYQFVDDLENE